MCCYLIVHTYSHSIYMIIEITHLYIYTRIMNEEIKKYFYIVFNSNERESKGASNVSGVPMV